MSGKIADPADNRILSSKIKFMILIAVTLLISLGLVIVSMWLYNTSGAAQLDLSRPGYQSVRSQSIDSGSAYQTYSSIGDTNQSTIDEFQLIYSEQSKKIKTIDAFSGDPLSPESMGFSEPTTK